MSDPQAWCLLLGLVVALALIAWALYAEARIQILSDKLALTTLKEKEDEADAKNRALSSSDMDAKLSKALGPGSKSKTS